MPIVLVDTPENIVERSEIFDRDTGRKLSDEEAAEYKIKHRRDLIAGKKLEISYYNNMHKHIPDWYDVAGKPVDVCARELAEMIRAFEKGGETVPFINTDLR